MSKHKDKLHELRRKRAALRAEFNAIVSKESDLPEGEALPEEDTNRLSAIETELEDIRGRLQRLETALEMESDEAKPVEGDAMAKSATGPPSWSRRGHSPKRRHSGPISAASRRRGS